MIRIKENENGLQCLQHRKQLNSMLYHKSTTSKWRRFMQETKAFAKNVVFCSAHMDPQTRVCLGFWFEQNNF